MHAVLPLLMLLAGGETATKPQVGDAARPFSLQASTGATVNLADYLGKNTVVLAFFPKAFTGGCTKEMSGLRDSHAQFADANAKVLGVSMDNLETQTKFAESLKTPFPLLADPEGTVARAWGVYTETGENRYASRVTFVIGKDGKIAKVIEGKDAIDPGLTLGACQKPAAP